MGKIAQGNKRSNGKGLFKKKQRGMSPQNGWLNTRPQAGLYTYVRVGLRDRMCRAT